MTGSARHGRALRTWYAVLGAPGAWALFQVAGVGLSEAACSRAGADWSISQDAWLVALTAAAGIVALGAEIAAVSTFRSTRGPGHRPPAARVHFLAGIGITVGALFLVLILMSGIGAVLQSGCVQS